ncbi:podocalyxin [Camelus bactrianus]|uniref:Podocalyxin n=1 Tax=Camelus bactrianus TaxID=9837 RepID=A0AC58QNX0_CAMBA
MCTRPQLQICLDKDLGSVGGPAGHPQRHLWRHLRARWAEGYPAPGAPAASPPSSHAHTPVRSGAARPEPGARRAPPPAARQGGVSSSAHCSLPSAAPPRPRAPGGGDGAGAGADGTGVAAVAGLAAAAQIPPVTQPPAAPLPPGSAPQPVSAAAASRRGSRSATRESRVTARPPNLRPGLPERRPRSRRPAARPLSQVRSHLLWAGGQDTMRSAPVLSALLLLLPSLWQNALSSDNGEVSQTDSASSEGLTKTEGDKVSSSVEKPLNLSEASGSVPVTSNTSVQQQTTTTASDKADSDNTTKSKTTTVSMKPENISSQNGISIDTTGSGTQSNHSVTTSSMTTKEGTQTASEPQNLSKPSDTTTAVTSLTTPASTPQSNMVPVPSKPSGNSSEGPKEITTAASSGPVAGPTVTTQGMLTTSVPQVSSPGTQHTSSNMPAVTGSSAALQPTGSSLGPATSSPVAGPTSSNAPLMPTASQGSSTPSIVSVVSVRGAKIQCESPEAPKEKMLILNLSTPISCEASPFNEKLVTLLCQAANATFSLVQDECCVRLAPVIDFPGVQIKEVTIRKRFSPKDVYELLHNKWDALKGVGVTNMALGDRGPPEETEDRFSMPLIITIVCMASFLLLVAALYGCCHQRLSQRKDQQRLTEELQTVENGYHDNPTLEVMETSSEMQEKKVVNLNGELGDSWIVPLDNLTKDDLDEEEDTHL